MRVEEDWVVFETYSERKAAAPITEQDQYRVDEFWYQVPKGSTHIPEALEVRRRLPAESIHF